MRVEYEVLMIEDEGDNVGELKEMMKVELMRMEDEILDDRRRK
jgi:hypothetical protein